MENTRKSVSNRLCLCLPASSLSQRGAHRGTHGRRGTRGRCPSQPCHCLSINQAPWNGRISPHCRCFLLFPYIKNSFFFPIQYILITVSSPGTPPHSSPSPLSSWSTFFLSLFRKQTGIEGIITKSNKNKSEQNKANKKKKKSQRKSLRNTYG